MLRWSLIFLIGLSEIFALSIPKANLRQITSRSSKGNRIFGGETAVIGEFPFMAGIFIDTANGKYFCTGSLIDSLWVVTSGNCVNDALIFEIRMGSNYLDAEIDTIVASSFSVRHQDYNLDTFENDIALIKLRFPVQFSWNLNPIHLPFAAIEEENPNGIYAIGWGETSETEGGFSNVLQRANVVTITNQECAQVYGEQIVTANKVCVGGNGHEGFCLGDNGGPLLQFIEGWAYHSGVASFISGNGCDTPEPSGYLRTLPYVGWINSTREANS